MLRLVAQHGTTTRLILSRMAMKAPHAAGHVIESVRQASMMSGNFVIGIIVFTILVIVNFVVITKGSGRIAEVAGPGSHLDSMPGKQMAIDADLSSGLHRPGPSQAAPEGTGAGIDLLRRHGRRLEVRARRRRRRPDHPGHQRDRRHPDRGDPAQGADRPGVLDLHHHVDRRRSGQPDPGADHLDRRGLPGVEGPASRAPPTRPWSPQLATNPISLGMGRRRIRRPGHRAGHADYPLRPACRGRRDAGLEAVARQAGGRGRRDRRRAGRGRGRADLADAGHRRDQDRAGLRPAAR